jgi:hypothetical protein
MVTAEKEEQNKPKERGKWLIIIRAEIDIIGNQITIEKMKQDFVKFIVVLGGVHCGIYKSSYNIYNILY